MRIVWNVCLIPHEQVSFHPGDAINFYERAYVVVEHGAPQQIDLLGTCFSEHCRPAPFTQDQVEATQSLPLLVRPRVTPTSIRSMRTCDDVLLASAASLLRLSNVIKPKPSMQCIVAQLTCTEHGHSAACRLTITNSSPASARFDALITSRDRAPVTIVEAVEGVDFGSCPTMAGTQTRVVHVRNNSDSKVKLSRGTHRSR